MFSLMFLKVCVTMTFNIFIHPMPGEQNMTGDLITMTQQRSTAVSFTMPVQQEQVKLFMKRPSHYTLSWMTFLQSFDMQVRDIQGDHRERLFVLIYGAQKVA